MREHLELKRRVERAAANQRPQRAEPRFAITTARSRFEGEFLALNAQFTRCAPLPLRQNSLSSFAEINVPARQPRDQLVVDFIRQINLWGARRVLVAQTIEPPFESIHTLGITRSILRAMITVVPVQDV